MQTLTRLIEWLCSWTRKLGPYVLIEIVLPGGTMLALLLFLYRRRKTTLAPTALAS
jgi:hypothetical protein